MREPDWVDDRGRNIRYRYFFDNGYGASVATGYSTYGGDEGLWELAVIISNTPEWKSPRSANESFQIVYDTPITNDVLGYLTEGDVDDLLNQIESLPKREYIDPWLRNV
jgi:hypothetical protein